MPCHAALLERVRSSAGRPAGGRAGGRTGGRAGGRPISIMRCSALLNGDKTRRDETRREETRGEERRAPLLFVFDFQLTRSTLISELLAVRVVTFASSISVFVELIIRGILSLYAAGTSPHRTAPTGLCSVRGLDSTRRNSRTIYSNEIVARLCCTLLTVPLVSSLRTALSLEATVLYCSVVK